VLVRLEMSNNAVVRPLRITSAKMSSKEEEENICPLYLEHSGSAKVRHRAILQGVEVPFVQEIYFINEDAVIMTCASVILALKQWNYEIYTSPFLDSPSDRIVALSISPKHRIIAIGYIHTFHFIYMTDRTCSFRSGQVRILDAESGRIAFDQFECPVRMLHWTATNTLYVDLVTGARWAWFEANDTERFPHMLERAGWEFHETCGTHSVPVKNPNIGQLDTTGESLQRHIDNNCSRSRYKDRGLSVIVRRRNFVKFVENL